MVKNIKLLPEVLNLSTNTTGSTGSAKKIKKTKKEVIEKIYTERNLEEQLLFLKEHAGPMLLRVKAREKDVIDFRREKKINKITPESPEYEDFNLGYYPAMAFDRFEKRELRLALKTMVDNGEITPEVVKYFMKHFSKKE